MISGTSKVVDLKTVRMCFILICTIFVHSPLSALVFTDQELKIFQFPNDMIPRIDGNTEDWDMVTEDYIYNSDMMINTLAKKGESEEIDQKDFHCRVRVGWVKGLNRLYFLYEAYDDYWEFESPNIINDLFEIMVDTDLSGGSFVFREIENFIRKEEEHLLQKGSHAQNFHIYTPCVGKSWAQVWNCPYWIGRFPYFNRAFSYDFKQGESGKLIMECWITPFDYISFEGPEYSTVSRLKENDIIGLSWLVADFEGKERRDANYSLAHENIQVPDATTLRPFRLMPLERKFYKNQIKANFTFTIVEKERKMCAYKDLSDSQKPCA